VLVDDGRVAAVGDRVDAPAHAERFDARGGAVLPGLHDHHVHLVALAARRASIDVSPDETPDHRRFVATLRAAAGRSAPDAWLRAVGYHERTAGDLDRVALDAIVADRPLRVQHRSGALWTCNSAALARLGLLEGPVPAGCELDEHGTPTGRLFRLDDWMRDRVPRTEIDLAAVGRALAGYGVTGVTDATPYPAAAALHTLACAVDARALPLRVHVTGAPGIAPRDVPPPLTPGPAKIVLPDHELPALDEVVVAIRTARSHDRAVAIHCVTRAALALGLAALEATGPHRDGDRIEHGAVIGSDALAWLRRARVTVVTQPNFVAERGDDYLADVDDEDRHDLWRCASLAAAGVPVGAGSDAPHGDADPWRLLWAATARRTGSGAVVGAAERVSPRRALDLVLSPPGAPGGPPRRVAPGAAADLCVLDAPLEAALRDLPANPVRATFLAGTPTHLPT
jgi:predicted amidohydrolase YtcJ